MSNNTFFCGTQYGKVRQADAQNWGEFFDKYLATPIPLQVTRAQYAQLGDKEKKAVKKVPYYTSARFALPVSDRQTQHAVACSLVTLDIDDAAPAAYLLENLSMVESVLAKLNYVLHHTTSSTPAHPRLRLVVEAKDIPLTRYPAAVHTLQQMLNLERIDPSSDKMVQPMYRPSHFLDEHPTKSSPIILVAKNGSPFTEDMISGERQHGANARASRTSEASTDNDNDNSAELDNLRNPVDGITLTTVASTLAHLDADMEYTQWLSVAAGLKHQFHGTPEEEEAFDLFNDWSAQGQKYTTLEETRAKWDSFAHTPKGRAPATFRSVLHMAKEAGYDLPSQRPSPATPTAAPAATTPKELADITFSQLLPLRPQPSKLEMVESMTTLAKTIKTLFKVNVTPAALYRDYSTARKAQEAAAYAAQRAEAIAQNDGEFPVPDWVAPFVYISATEKFYDKDKGVAYSARAFNATFSRELTPTAEDVDDPAQLSRPRVLPTDYATNEIRIPAVVDFIYSPAHPKMSLIENNGSLYINSYKPSYAPADPSTAQVCGEALTRHLAKIIEEPEHQRTLLDWFAYNVQNPGKKIMWAPLVGGGQGIGKTLLLHIMSAALGETNVYAMDGSSLFSSYNEWAQGHQLIAVEEVRVHSKSRYMAMDKLKPLITNRTVEITQKYQDNRCVPNITNYIFFSNAHDALAIDDSNRRYFVIQSPLQTRNEVATLGGEAYFAPIYKLINDHPGGFRAFLLNHAISPAFDPNGTAPKTKYMDDLIESSANDLTALIRQIISDNDHPLIGKDLISFDRLRSLVQEESLVCHIQQLRSTLTMEGYRLHGRLRIDDGNRHRVWIHKDARIPDPAATLKTRVAASLDTAARDHFNERSEFKEQSDFSPTDTPKTLQQEIDELL
jgi:hypothetical protein